jgi:hypothetical protein
LRTAFAIVLVLSGIKLVKVPAADTIVEVGVALGALVFVAWGLRSLRTRRVPAHDAA